MKILGIDTSTSVASVALIDENKLIGQMTIDDKKTHSQKLLVLIDNLLKISDITLDDIDAIAVAVGPGSFTGLRIGITTAKALAHSRKIKIHEISSLEALSNNLKTSYLICPMMDARRNTVFASLYSDEILIEDIQIDIEELLEKILKYKKEVIFLGDGALKYKEIILKKLGEYAIIAPPHLLMSSAASLCELALNKYSDLYVAYDEVQVKYLKKTQAEREYEEKQELKI